MIELFFLLKFLFERMRVGFVFMFWRLLKGNGRRIIFFFLKGFFLVGVLEVVFFIFLVFFEDVFDGF